MPDIAVLPGNPEEVLYLLGRERADLKKVLATNEFLTPKLLLEVGQLAVNIDYLLDRYPDGTVRELGNDKVS